MNEEEPGRRTIALQTSIHAAACTQALREIIAAWDSLPSKKYPDVPIELRNWLRDRVEPAVKSARVTLEKRNRT